MLRVLTVLLVVGAVMAEDCCSSEDRHELQELWKEIWSAAFTGRRVQVAQAVFTDLFEHDPAAKSVFKNVNVDDMNSPEFRAHCIRVVNGLDTLIGLLDDTKTLKQQLDHLGKQHDARPGVKVEHFDEIAKSFARVMPQVSTCFNPDAWNRCFNKLAHAIADGIHH